ncbi:MAG: ABC transporter permease [Actinomycetota bacterium]|nr:ABC transporter permease [Actinomycetota bacterium]
MTQTAQLFTASLKMLVRDKTAFLMALTFPVVFVLAFSVFDVSFSAEGALTGVDYFEYVLPALLAIGLMNFAMVGTAASVARYRELKILKRIVVTPLPASRFIAGQVGARLTLAAVQTGLIMIIGLLVGGTLGSGWPLLFVISTLGNLIFLSLGFAIAGRVASVDAANNMAGLATTPLMFLSGSFFPIDSMPGWLQPLADLLPLTPLIDSMRAIALQGAGITDIGSELALIGAWIVGGLALARMTFRFNEA